MHVYHVTSLVAVLGLALPAVGDPCRSNMASALGGQTAAPGSFSTRWTDMKPQRWSSTWLAVTCTESFKQSMLSSRVARAEVGSGLRSGFRVLVRSLRLPLWVLLPSFVMWGQWGAIL